MYMFEYLRIRFYLQNENNMDVNLLYLKKLWHTYVTSLYLQIYENIIRIFREGRIEKSVPRIAVWHHEACRVMTNGDLEGRIFQSYPQRLMDYFSCSALFVFMYFLFIYLV